MTVHLWVGPTLPEENRAAIPGDVVVHEPAHAGVLADVDPGAGDLLIVADGVYWSAAALQLPEILAAVSLGATFVGVSSYGALRAADLGDMPGVRGPGVVSQMIRTGDECTDADVAVVHDADPPYDARSLPLVNLVVTQRALASCLSVAEHRAAGRVIRTLRRMSLHERTWHAFAALLSAQGCEGRVAELFRKRYVDQKCDDLLEVLADLEKLADPSLRATWQPTVWWEGRLAASQRVRSEMHGALIRTAAAVPLACDGARLAAAIGQVMGWWQSVCPREQVEFLMRPRTIEHVRGLFPPAPASPQLHRKCSDGWLLPGEHVLPQFDRCLIRNARDSYVPPALRLLCRAALVGTGAESVGVGEDELREWARQVEALSARQSIPLSTASIIATEAELLALLRPSVKADV